ncbi:hypothetical protein BH23ACT6_BH23ACT6_16670 [soil metagenome]
MSAAIVHGRDLQRRVVHRDLASGQTANGPQNSSMSARGDVTRAEFELHPVVFGGALSLWCRAVGP